MRKIYNKKSQVDSALLGLCRAACDVIRGMIGDDQYRFLACCHSNELAYFIAERQEYYVVGTATLIYGSGCAFVELARCGFEREAIQLQRHVMEYYFLARYYSKHARWSFIHWVDSVKDEANFLESVIAHHGSRERLTQLKRDAKDAKLILAGIPKEDRQHIRPSIETLAKQYALRESDYTMLYRWPSQIAHATFLGMNYGWMNDNTPRFDSAISSINARSVTVAEYLIAFIEALEGHVTVKRAPNIKDLRRSLRSIRTRLKIRATKTVTKPARRRRRAA